MTQLERQLASQGQELSALREKLAIRGDPLPPREDTSVSEASHDVKMERAVVQAPVGLVASDGQASPVLEKSVRAVIDRVKDEEKQAQLAKDKEQREKRVKDRVEKLTPDLGLDGYQAGQLTKVLIDTDEKLAALRNGFRQGGGGPGGPGFDPTQPNPFTDIMTQRDEQLKLVLSSSQMEKLDESDPSRRWMRNMQNNNDPNQRGRNGNGNGGRRNNGNNAASNNNGNG
jgi:hypothetical protein